MMPSMEMSLRGLHTFATLSLLGGKSIMWVSRQLGHKSIQVTLDVYGHVLPGEEVDLSYLPEVGAGAKRLSVVQQKGGKKLIQYGARDQCLRVFTSDDGLR